MFGENTYLWIIIALNVVISLRGFKDSSFMSKYLFNVGAIKAGQVYRNITSGFLHANEMHLLVNMLTLYFFGPYVIDDKVLGAGNFLLVYLGSLIAGSALAFYYHKNNNYYNALGASGAVTGIVYSAITFDPTMKLYLYFLVPIPAFVFGIGYLFYSIYGMKNSIGNIGHTAHLGGAVAGFVFTLLLKPELIEKQPLMTVLLLIPIVLLFVGLKKGKL